MTQQASLFEVNHTPQVPKDWKLRPLPSLSAYDALAVDFETTGLRWFDVDRPVGIALYHPDGLSEYVGWGHAGGNHDPERVKEWARAELRGKRLINLNMTFDALMARRWGIDLEELGCTFGDPGHYAALLDDNKRSGFSLEALSRLYLIEGKVTGIDVTRMASYHAAEVEAYAVQDVKLAWKLACRLRRLLAEEDLENVADLEDETLPVTVEMMWNGAPIDVEKLDRWIVSSEQAYLRLLWQVHRETGVRVNPNSSDDVLKLYRKLNLKVTKLTATGKASFDESVLSACDHPVVRLVALARKIDGQRDRYLLKYKAGLGSDGLLRYALHQLRADEGGTISGRYSSSALKGPGWSIGANVQQVTTAEKQRLAFGYDEDDDSHDDEIFIIRELYIAPPGRRAVAADAAQIEFRFFVHLSQNPRLIDAYVKDQNTNFHKLVFREFIAPVNPTMPYKQVKNTNFMKLYGGGVKKAALMLGCGLDKAREFLNSYDRALPDARRLLEESTRRAENDGYVTTILGRRCRFPGRERTHKALNGIIQGSAADYQKRKQVELHAERRSTGMTLRLTNHDEFFGDVPDDEAATRVRTILDRQAFNLSVPILWSVRTGANWKECK